MKKPRPRLRPIRIVAADSLSKTGGGKTLASSAPTGRGTTVDATGLGGTLARTGRGST